MVEMAPVAYTSSWSLSWQWMAVPTVGGEHLWPQVLDWAGVGEDGALQQMASPVLSVRLGLSHEAFADTLDKVLREVPVPVLA